MKYVVVLVPLLLAFIVARPGVAADAAGRGPSALQPVVVTAGLDSPRGLAFGPSGELYVADSGSAARPGSGRVARIAPDGGMGLVLEGATNSTAAPHGPTYVFGLSDVAVAPDGLLLTIGFSSSAPGLEGAPNRLLKLGWAGGLGELFDLDRFERERDPDGRGPGSNATGIARAPDGSLWISDAGGNWAAHLSAAGAVQTLVAFSGTDGEEAVPTGLAIGPDGNAYVALFRCLVPTAGKGGVARVRTDGRYDLVASGLNMPIDVAFDAAGALHVLEFALDYAPDSGRLLRLAADGSTETLADGLRYPTSLAVDGAGRIYVTQMDAVAGGPPGSGKLVRFDP